MKKRILCGILCLFLLLSLTGCSSWDDSSQFDALSEYYQNENKAPEPELTDFVLPYCATETLDPITCSDGFQLTLTSLLYEGLYELDKTWTAHPLLAGSYHYDPESFTYTIKLRDDARFSDGSSVSAYDVVTTLERARTSTRYGARFALVDAMDYEGDTVTVTLKENNRLFTALLDIPIVKASTEGCSVPTGTGPYVISRDDGGSCLIHNENWWQSKTLPFSRIALLSYNNQESAAYAFSARDVQLAFCDLTATNTTAITGSGNVTDVGTSILHYIGFNTANTLFADPQVRCALSLAIERDTLVDAYLLGHAGSAQFPLSPDSAIYPADLEQITSADTFSQAMTDLGLHDKTEMHYVTMIVNSENPFKVSMAHAIAKAMSTSDIQVNVSVLPWEEFLQALENREFDLYYGEVKMTADWDSSSLICPGGSLNYGGFSDPELDLCMLNYLTSGEAKREDTMRSLCLRFQKDMPIIPLCFTNRSLLLSPGAVDNVSPTAGNPFYGLENWEVHIKGIS